MQIRYIHFETIDSTNLWAKNNAANFNPDQFTCITASEQTAGKGRLNRNWISPKGLNIYATFYFTLPKGCPFLAQLAQVLSLSCATVLKAKGFQPEIKWPNDITLAGKKVSGILCEILDMKDYYGIVIGIGVNVNMESDLLQTIDQPATSLAQISGKKWDLKEILTPLVEQFIKDLDILKSEKFSYFFEEYNKLLAFKGKMITLNPTPARAQVSGICKSIDREGRLLLLLPSGEMMKLTSLD